MAKKIQPKKEETPQPQVNEQEELDTLTIMKNEEGQVYGYLTINKQKYKVRCISKVSKNGKPYLFSIPKKIENVEKGETPVIDIL